MARKRTTSPSPSSAARSGLTAERTARLYRLLRLLSTPQNRQALIRRLRIDVRGFYRDLESLRTLGIGVALEGGRYTLDDTVDAALACLPFPDPQLTCSEALLLAKGRTGAHRKLREKIARLTT
jgi:predicted DNA-binding transcriptional regulator YafY